MKNYIVSAFFLTLFTIVFTAAAFGQSCPKVTFLHEAGDKLDPGSSVRANFQGRKKIELDSFTYTWTVSAGKVVHADPTDYYMKIDGVAEGTRVEVKVTAARGSCKSSASAWFLAGPSEEGSTPTPPAPTPSPKPDDPLVIPPPPPCPKLKVSAAGTVKAGTTAIFTADFTGLDKESSPTFNWQISAGTIISGQGTNRIEVDTSGVEGPLKATVDIGGLYGCMLYESGMTKVTTTKY